MEFSEVSAIADVLAALGVIASLLFVAYQVRNSARKQSEPIGSRPLAGSDRFGVGPVTSRYQKSFTKGEGISKAYRGRKKSYSKAIIANFSWHWRLYSCSARIRFMGRRFWTYAAGTFHFNSASPEHAIGGSSSLLLRDYPH